MFAVIKTGGKQYKVKEGTVLKLEKIKESPGELIEFKDILMLQDNEKNRIGSPLVDGVLVTAEVTRQGRHKKINVIKFRRRKHSMKHQGHRQYYTEVKVTKIKN